MQSITSTSTTSTSTTGQGPVTTPAQTSAQTPALAWEELVQQQPHIPGLVAAHLNALSSSLNKFQESPGAGTGFCVDACLCALVDTVAELRRKQTLTPERKFAISTELRRRKQCSGSSRTTGRTGRVPRKPPVPKEV